MTQRQNILKAIDEKRLFDYVANNSYSMDRDVIHALLKELTYTLTDEQLEDLKENLIEYEDFEGEE